MNHSRIISTVFSISLWLNSFAFSTEVIPEENDILDVSFAIPSDQQINQFVADHNLYLNEDARTQAAGDEVRSKIGLSINGGGIRGLIPALYLQHLETALAEADIGDIKAPLHKIFDYVGGTSVGGILSLGLAADLRTDEMIQMFDNHRHRIFGQKRRIRLLDWFGLVSNQYKANGLEDLLQETFQQKTLVDLKTDVLVTACTTTGHPVMFKKGDEHNHYPLWEIGRSTSAAPTFFPAYQPTFDNQRSLVDGGVWVNNPSTLIAASIVREHQDGVFDPNKLHLLSLGTGEINTRAISNSAGKTHAVQIIDALFNSHDRGNHLLMTQLLNENYTRINPQLNRAIDLDNTDQGTIDDLRIYGNQAVEKEQLRQFVANTGPLIRSKLERQDDIVD